MKTTKIIICDSNVVFGIFWRILYNQEITHSVLFDLAELHEVYISEYILAEISTVFERDYDLEVQETHIQKFFDISNFYIIESEDKTSSEILKFVSDPKDAAILQDAINICADFLLTKNIKDYKIDNIYEQFHISVINNIPLDLLY